MKTFLLLPAIFVAAAGGVETAGKTARSPEAVAFVAPEMAAAPTTTERLPAPTEQSALVLPAAVPTAAPVAEPSVEAAAADVSVATALSQAPPAVRQGGTAGAVEGTERSAADGRIDFDGRGRTREGSNKVFLQVILADNTLDVIKDRFTFFDYFSRGHRRLHPQRPIRTVVATSHEELARRLQRALGPGESVSQLLIHAHGNFARLGRGGSITHMLTGDFGSTRGRRGRRTPYFSAEFQELFSPLRGRLAEGADIILHSCLVLGGQPREAVRRAAALGRFFGVRRYSVFGATTLESTVAPPRSRQTIVLPAALAVFFVALGLGIAVAGGAPLGAAAGFAGIIAGVVSVLFGAVSTLMALGIRGLFIVFDGKEARWAEVGRNPHLARFYSRAGAAKPTGKIRRGSSR